MKKTRFILLSSFILIASVLASFATKKNKYTPIHKEIYESQKDTVFDFGKALFRVNCRGCHSQNMTNVSTAPPLGGVTKIRNREWLYKYTKNSQRMFVEGDSIAAIFRNQNWGLMPAFPMLQNSDLDKIFYYVEKRYEMSLQGIPVPIEFEFNISENNRAKACKHILHEKRDILEVFVTITKNWKFSCGKKNIRNLIGKKLHSRHYLNMINLLMK